MRSARGRGLGALAFAVLLGATVEVVRAAPCWERATYVVGWLLAAGVAWCAAMWLARRGGLGLGHVLLGAVLLRGVALCSFPDLSDDLYRYAWEGQRVLEGISPYAHAPSAPELEAARAASPELYAAVNHPDVSAAYPPLTQLACAAVVGVARALGVELVLALRTFFTLCDLLVLWPLVVLLARSGLPRSLCVVWAWCPLVTLEFAGSGHFDSLGILLLVTSLALLTGKRGAAREAWGLAALAGAVLVKYLPLAALPFVARERGGWSRLVTTAALVGLGFLPFVLMDGGAGLFSGLGQYGLRWEGGSLVQRHLEPLVELLFSRDGSLLDSRVVTRLILAGAWAATLLHAWRGQHDPVRATGAAVAAFLLLTPTLHPWYATWLVPFLALRPRSAWVWLVLALPTSYLSLARWKLEGEWVSSPFASWFIALPFFALLGQQAWRARAAQDPT